MASVRNGLAVLRAYKTLQALTASPATARFGATRRAGAAADVALRLRQHGRLTFEHVTHFAAAAGIDESDLRLSLVPLLADAGLVEVRSVEGATVEIEEFVGVAQPILQQCSVMWELAKPSLAETCAIEGSDHCAYVPATETELQELFAAFGLPESEHHPVLKTLLSVALVRRQRSKALGEDIYFSPYVWGNAVDVAEFMARLPANEREVLTRVARQSADRPGSVLDSFGVDEKLLLGARKVGLLDATRVVTSDGVEKAFAFPAGLEHRIGGGSTDATHERKLFTAHIIFGHRFGYPGTGRIRSPLVLVNALLNNRTVGPATAISKDYPLLEGHGIVRVEPLKNGRAYLHLVKDDVARDSLELLKLALQDEGAVGGSEDGLESLWVPGSVFRGPEEDRALIPEPDVGATTEVLNSTVEHLREEQQRRLRGEEP